MTDRAKSPGVLGCEGPSPLPDCSVEIRRGHSLELIEDMGEYDLLCTDPPYAMGGEGAEHAISATVATTLREAGKRLRKGGWAVVFAASSWRSTYYMIESVRGVLEPVRFGTWVKPVARSRVRTPGWSWASVNVIVLRRPGKPGPGSPVAELDHITAAPLIVGRRAQLPPEVARWAVAPFAVPGGVALDPFAGSGALCRAAADAGMRAIGFEIEDSGAGLVPPGEAGEVDSVVSALHDQFFCGCEWGYDAEHHPGDRQEWEKAARIAAGRLASCCQLGLHDPPACPLRGLADPLEYVAAFSSDSAHSSDEENR